MHMDSLLNDSCRVAFAGLIYNLDTLFQRANLKGESPADALRSILGRAPVLEGETAPFSPQGSDEANGETLEKVVTHLQRPETFLQSVVATAGRLSAGFERELYDDEGKSAKAQNPLRTRLRALFEEVSISDPGRTLSANALKKCYALQPLTPKSLFPVNLAESEPRTDAAASDEYAQLWRAFSEALRKSSVDAVAGSFTSQWPLWLDAFDTLLLTYTHAIPFFAESGVKPDVSLYDHAKTTAALATALWRWHEARGETDSAAGERLRSLAEEDEAKFLLIQGDFFGIQDFIFSEGAETNKNSAKVLRGRSFDVSLICELAALKVLEALSLPPTSLIINAAGKFLIVAPNTEASAEALDQVRRELNAWFVDHAFATCSVGLVSTEASCRDFTAKRYGDLLDRLFADMESAKFQRFDLAERKEVVLNADFPHGVCRWQAKLPADGLADGASCALSRDQILIGRALTKHEHLLILKETAEVQSSESLLVCEMPIFGYRAAFAQRPGADKRIEALGRSGDLLRCWDFALPGSEDEVLWKGLARRAINGYVPHFEETDLTDAQGETVGRGRLGEVKTFEDLASADVRDGHGVRAVMTLKGDVDNLGLIFRRGLVHEDRDPAKRRTLNFAKTAELSRKMNGFFSTWLPLLCAQSYRNVYTVFAGGGGDDFFMIGPWHEIQQLAARLKQDFDAYVAENPEIHFSAGLVMTKPAVPAKTLSQLAEEALGDAKAAGKNRLALFANIVEWKDLQALHDLEAFLRRAADEYGVTTAYMYGLFEILDMSADTRNPAASMWRSRLYYNTTRLFEREARRRSVDVEQARNEFLQTVARGVERHQAAFRIPLSNVFYSIREVK